VPLTTLAQAWQALSQFLANVAQELDARGQEFQEQGGLWNILAIMCFNLSIEFSDGAQITLRAADLSRNVQDTIDSVFDKGFIYTFLSLFGWESYVEQYPLQTALSDWFEHIWWVRLYSLLEGDNEMGYDFSSWLNYLMSAFYDPGEYLGELWDLRNMRYGLPWYGFSFFFRDPVRFVVDLLTYWSDYDLEPLHDPVGWVISQIEEHLLQVIYNLRDSLYSVLARLIRYFLEGVWAE